MKALLKLTRNGNATMVCVPRRALAWLGWLQGQIVCVEVLEDKSLHVRKPTIADMSAKKPPNLTVDSTLPGLL